MIGHSVTCVSSMADIGACDFSSSVKYVLERFHIEKFRETQLEAIINLLQGKDIKMFLCYSLRAKGNP